MTSRYLIIISIFGLLVSCGHPNDRVQELSNADIPNMKFPAELLNKNGELHDDYDTLVTTIENYHFSLTPTGKLFWGDTALDTIYLVKDTQIESGYVFLSTDTLFVFYTDTDGEGATSWLEKINLKNGKQTWRTSIYGFNLSLPYIVGNFVYVASIGHVGKIDMTSGKYIFEFSDLYDNKKYSFNNFDSVIFRDSLTFFLSKNGNSKNTDTVIVNERTLKFVTKK